MLDENNKKLKIYLDNCCFNRPFDDQTQIRICLETQAKLFIQELIASDKIELVWSYILKYENSKNPFLVRQKVINNFSKHATTFITENDDILCKAREIKSTGIKVKDSLHLSCAIFSKCNYFISTDDRLLKYCDENIRIVDPIGFVKILEEIKDYD